MNVKMKRCRACRVLKSLPMFDYFRDSPDGRQYYCRHCRKMGYRMDPTDREKRLEARAFEYARTVLYPVYQNWKVAHARARSAYGL